MSKSANSGPSPSRRSFFAPSAILRRSRSARPAWEAILGSSCGPKMTSAITARTSSLGRFRSNKDQPSIGQVSTLHSRPSRRVPAQRNGLTQDASRTMPRDMRFQNPAGLSCGSTPTTASTVSAGASTITVYTMPRLDQVRDR